MKKFLAVILALTITMLSTMSVWGHTITRNTTDIVGYYTYEMTDTSARTLYPHVFSHYLTSSWAMASQYTWQQATTYSLSFQGNFTSDVSEQVKLGFNLTGSITKTYSISITIPANSSRYSKLAYFSDIYKQNFNVKKTSSYPRAGVTQTDYYSATSNEPTSTTYLDVVYKDALPPGAYIMSNEVSEDIAVPEAEANIPADTANVIDTVETDTASVPAQ